MCPDSLRKATPALRPTKDPRGLLIAQGQYVFNSVSIDINEFSISYGMWIYYISGEMGRFARVGSHASLYLTFRGLDSTMKPCFLAIMGVQGKMSLHHM